MFPMTPLQSWVFLVLLALLVIFSIQLVRQLGNKDPDMLENETSQDEYTSERTVPHRDNGRHLHAVGPHEGIDDTDDNPLSIWKDVLDS